MKKFVALLLAFILVMSLVGCGAKEEPAMENKETQGAAEKQETVKDITIGVSFRNLQDIFYQNLRDAIQNKADELGVKLVIQEANNDADKQFAQMQDLVTQKVDAIILAPVATSGSSTAVDLAVQEDIPVFTVDNPSDSETGVISHIATDNYLGGQIAAQYMAEKVLPEGGDIILITLPTVESCLAREQGFADYLKEKNITNINVLDAINGKADSNEAMSVMQDCITKYGDQIDAVYTVTDGMGFGVKSAIETSGLDIEIVSFTGNPQALAYIAEDTCFTATMRQDTVMMGSNCIVNAVAYLNGETVEAEYYIEPVPVDINNVAEYQ